MVRSPRFPARVAAACLSVAMLMAAVGPHAAATASPVFTEFDVPTPFSIPTGIALGPDGAMWFTERGADVVGRLTTDGAFTEFPLAAGSGPTAITAGPDGSVWFAEQSGNRIGRLTPAGELVEYGVPTDPGSPAGLAAGPDGAIWFTERTGHAIGRIDVGGNIDELAIPTATSGPLGIAQGSDGAMWFTEQRANKIARIDMAGNVTEFPLAQAGSLPSGITAGPDGALWFTQRAANRIGRITIGGAITTFPVPTAASDPTSIAAGADGALWFTEPDVDQIGRVTVDGSFTEYALPQVGSSPFGIALGSDDALWFTEGNGNRIGRLGEPVTPPDVTPPVVTLAAPADGAVFLQRRQVAAVYVCVDEPGGSGLATCAGTVDSGGGIDTSPGAHRFEVSASDLAGNTAWASHGYVAFSSLDGSLATVQQHAGRWATLELGLGTAPLPRDVGAVVAAGYPMTQRVDCADPSVALEPLQSVDARISTRRAGVVLRWRTDRAWAGTCRALVMRFVLNGWTGADAVFPVTFN